MPKVKIKKENGEITLGEHNLDRIIQMLSDGEWEVKIKRWKDKRSTNQNNLYWKWVTIIGNELGYRKGEMHETLLAEFAPMKTIPKLDGGQRTVPIRTSEMKVDQMSEYMNAVEQLAAEMNIALPHPEEEMLADQKSRSKVGEAPF